MSTRALIFSPVLPEWDCGAAVAPLAAKLSARGILPQVVDTCAFAERATSIEHLAELWSAELAEADPVDLICGNALGGAVAVAFAAALPDELKTPVLTVSGPVRATPLLKSRLSEIAALADEGDLQGCMSLLQVRVGGNEAASPASAIRSHAVDTPSAAQRIARGLTLLSRVDLGKTAAHYPHQIVSIVGEQSQLVTSEHCPDGPLAQTIVVRGVGMRPHHSHPESVDDALDRLGITLQETA